MTRRYKEYIEEGCSKCGWETMAGSWVMQANVHASDAPHTFEVAKVLDLVGKERRAWVNALAFILAGVKEISE